MILDFGEAGHGVDMVEPWPARETGADGRPYGVVLYANHFLAAPVDVTLLCDWRHSGSMERGAKQPRVEQ